MAPLIATLILGAWAAVLATDGSVQDLGDLMYLPVLLAAAVYGGAGGLVAAVLASIILLPSITPHLYSDYDQWAYGSLIYLAFGTGAGYVRCQLAERHAKLVWLGRRLEETYAKTLSLIARSLELRDVDTAGHSERVATNARLLALELGLGTEAADLVYWSGLLHDVGKIAVPEHILNKPMRLTADEMRVMQTHVISGAHLIRESSPDLDEIALAVRSHHERWDGSGYPFGLSGENIPLAGRLVAVADVFESLTARRPYRHPLPPGEALRYLQENKGTLFDGAAVEAFGRIVIRGDVVLFHDSAAQVGDLLEAQSA